MARKSKPFSSSVKLSPQTRQLMMYAGAGLLVLWYLNSRKATTASNQTPDSLAYNIGNSLTNIPVQAASDVFTGAVTGIGQPFGVPPTNLTQCQQDIAAGNTWASSFSCPAGTFISSLFK